LRHGQRIFSNFKDNYSSFVDNNYPLGNAPGQAGDIKTKVNFFGLAGTYDSVYIIGYAVTSASSGNHTGP